MEGVALIKVRLKQVELLQQLAKETFYTTWIHENSEQDMSAYLTEVFSLSRLTKELKNPIIFYYGLVYNGLLIGYLKANIGDEQTEFQYEDALEIERIYLKKEYQSKGLASLCMQKAFSLAKAHQKKRIWLGVSERNYQALALYKKYNFQVIGQHEFIIGNTIDIDLIMETIL